MRSQTSEGTDVQAGGVPVNDPDLNEVRLIAQALADAEEAMYFVNVFVNSQNVSITSESSALFVKDYFYLTLKWQFVARVVVSFSINALCAQKCKTFYKIKPPHFHFNSFPVHHQNFINKR